MGITGKNISALDDDTINAFKDLIVEQKFSFADYNIYNYSCIQEYLSDNFSTHTDGGTGTNTEGLYKLYDDLIAAYPDYVSKTEITRASDNIPIYRYDFEPPDNIDTTILKPKIFYTGMHSAEVNALGVAIRFFSDLCLNWKSSPLLEFLRWNVHFVVVPVSSPYGLNTLSGVNLNGVNLAYNFPKGWTEYQGEIYCGPSALSEVETQAIYNIITTEDFIFGIDHHNAYRYYISTDSGWIENRAMYFYWNIAFRRMGIYCDHIAKLFNGKFKRLSNIDDSNVSHFSINSGGTKAGGLHRSFPFPGVHIHTLYGWGSSAPQEASVDELQKVFAETLGIIFYLAAKVFE